MDEDNLLRRRTTAGSGISLRAVLGLTLLAFIGGAALIGWLAYDGRLKLGDNFAQSAISAPPTQASAATPALPGPSASPALSGVAGSAAAGGMDQRLAALEQRLARIDLQSAATEGNTARAEALLVALATRRAIERGAPLGYLEDQLKLRFGDAQANSVALLIDAAKHPATVDQLAMQLEELAPALLGTPANENSWGRFTRELSGLFVIRRGTAPSARPDLRLERARLLLRSGQVEAALAEVQRLPGASAAAEWQATARRYSAAQKALDLIETTALLDSDRLKDAEGNKIQQPGPATPVVSGIPEGVF